MVLPVGPLFIGNELGLYALLALIPLLLIYLLALLALIGVILSPFFWYNHDVTSQNTVIVIDASASSQVQEGTTTRFEIARSRAKDLLSSHNTVILAKEVPLIGIRDANSIETREYLDSIR